MIKKPDVTENAEAISAVPEMLDALISGFNMIELFESIGQKDSITKQVLEERKLEIKSVLKKAGCKFV